MLPRNNEYLQKQSKQTDLRGGPSPAQASDAPASDPLQSSAANSHQTANRLSIDTTPTMNKTSDFATVMKRLSASYAAAKTTATVLAAPKISPASSECSVSSFSNQPKVSLSRLRVEHVHSMETSLTEFAKQDPAVAIKLGVIEKPDEPMDVDESKPMRDMFTMMKADGECRLVF